MHFAMPRAIKAETPRVNDKESMNIKRRSQEGVIHSNYTS